MPGVKITLFLLKGEATSLRTADISNWNGKALAAPRIELDELIARSESKQPGVYILCGNDPVSGRRMAYIGEAEDVGSRLRKQREKEFWHQAIVFVSKDESLTKSHIKYLEGRIIEEAKKIGSHELDNDQTSGAKLPEADRDEMEVFLNHVRQLLPVLGSDLLVPITTTPQKHGSNERLICKIKDLVAYGNRSSGGFVVYKGSQAVAATRQSSIRHKNWAFNKRQELLASGILKAEDSYLCFTGDYEFSSPSAAASVIRGGNSNGLTNWRNAEGKLLKDIDQVG